jgi:hypothetical protein
MFVLFYVELYGSATSLLGAGADNRYDNMIP